MLVTYFQIFSRILRKFGTRDFVAERKVTHLTHLMHIFFRELIKPGVSLGFVIGPLMFLNTH